ncbi:MAG TPA: DUF2946 family protein [Alphaproteobacteria bacterium]|nr:DUF2946 family protein [Alphaproteobacteria bacterium]
MPPLLGTLRTYNTRAFFAWAALLAYLLQAFIPLGYMPDVAALQKGVFKITICTMQGAQPLALGKDEAPPPNHKKQADNFCPYGGSPKLAVNGFTPQLFASAFTFVQPPPIVHEFFVPRIFSSSAQARAPPLSISA